MSRTTLYQIKGKATRSDAAMLEDIRAAARTVGGPLSWPSYNAHRGPDALAAHAIMRRFGGSWQAACQQAGVEPGPRRRESYSRRYTPEQMTSRVAAYLADPTSLGSYADFERWTATQKDDGPSAQTVRNTLGRWNSIKAMALMAVDA